MLCLGLVILAWGTSPCLFASMISGGGAFGGDVADCGCGCCSEQDAAPADTPSSNAPSSGTDECPVCSSIGNMHELLPVGAKVALDAPVVAAAQLPIPSGAVYEAELCEAAPFEVALEPPRVQFCTTVALLR